MSPFNRFATCLVVVVSAAFARGSDPSASGYEFRLTPPEILARVRTLPGGAANDLTADEVKLLTAAWAGRAAADGPRMPPTTRELTDAMLFASGATSPADRAKYRKKFDAVLVAAKAKLRTAKTDADKGERLMQFLHGGVMKGGYREDRTRLTDVLDDHTFNCVSSSAVYYLVGRDLGLDLRALGIAGTWGSSGHACLDLVIKGERVPLEPTNKDGYDFDAKVDRPGVTRIGPKTDRSKAVETDGFGLAAMIYSNRGVAAGRAGGAGPRAALAYYAAALCLDPADPTAANNLLAGFVNWGPALMNDGRFEDAAAVLAAGLEVAPADGKLANNARVVWAKYLNHALDAGKDAELPVLLKRARAAAGGDEFDSAADWYRRLGERRLAAAGWEAGLAAADRGLPRLPEDERGRLRAWRVGLIRRWSQDLLAKGSAAESLAVLARGEALDPGANEWADAVAYHTQEALPAVARAGGAGKAAEHYAAVVARFPKADVSRVAYGFVQRAVFARAEDGAFDDALKVIDQYAKLLSEKDREELGGDVYDQKARKLAGDGNWENALDAYADGAKRYPGHGRLRNNGVATVDQWARGAMNLEDWDRAIEIYDAGLKRFPGDGHLEHNKKYCESKKR